LLSTFFGNGWNLVVQLKKFTTQIDKAINQKKQMREQISRNREPPSQITYSTLYKISYVTECAFNIYIIE